MSIDVIPENIEIYGVNNKNKTKKLKVYTAKEYMAKVKNAQEISQLFVILVGAIDAAKASETKTYFTGSTSTTGMIRGIPYSEYTNTNGSLLPMTTQKV